MPLLNTAAKPEQNMPPPKMPEEVSQEEPMEEPQEGGELTIDADQIAAEAMKELEPNMQQALKQTVNAGMKLLFDKQTHNQLFDSIRPEDEVPLENELGAGATNLMLLMYQQSKQQMPLEVIVPAGAILLAKACQFISESGMAEVTDEVFSESFQIFAVSIQDKLNPNFREENGLNPNPEQSQGTQDDVSRTVNPEQMAQPQTGGLLNQGAV
jgi:hypothetical protein